MTRNMEETGHKLIDGLLNFMVLAILAGEKWKKTGSAELHNCQEILAYPKCIIKSFLCFEQCKLNGLLHLIKLLFNFFQLPFLSI